ncbi:MAG: peroxiredoxin [Nanoarchaeota archaeon]
MLKEGDFAPNFVLKCTEGNYHSLYSFLGKKVVVYFYPKDDTPGCTKEAHGFKEDYKEIRRKNAIIIGISADGVDSHLNFKKKHELPFMLLSDPDYIVAKKYEVLKKFLGFNLKKIKRMTFLIDEKGKIMKIFNEVNPEGHSKEILSLL